MGLVTSQVLETHCSELQGLVRWLQEQETAIAQFKWAYANCLDRGGKLLFCGNGGSAADCQHIAAEYVVRFGRTRKALPALALTVDTSVLTAAGNDLGFHQVFGRQVEALGRPEDLLILHSTSGHSQNLVGAWRAAWEMSMPVVALLGKGGGIIAEQNLANAIVVPSHTTSHIQEVHMMIQHILVELVEAELGL